MDERKCERPNGGHSNVLYSVCVEDGFDAGSCVYICSAHVGSVIAASCVENVSVDERGPDSPERQFFGVSSITLLRAEELVYEQD